MRLLPSLLFVFVVGCSQPYSPVSVDNSQSGSLSIVCSLERTVLESSAPKSVLPKEKLVSIPAPTKYAYVLYGVGFDEVRDTQTISGDTIRFDFPGLNRGQYGFGFETLALIRGVLTRIHLSDPGLNITVNPGATTQVVREAVSVLHQTEATLPAPLPAAAKKARIILDGALSAPDDSETVVIADNSVPVKLGVPLAISASTSYKITVDLLDATDKLIYTGSSTVTINPAQNSSFTLAISPVSGEIGVFMAKITVRDTHTTTSVGITYE